MTKLVGIMTGSTAGPAEVGFPPVLLPVALRLEGRRCLVVGGGPVAERRTRDLLSCGARVTVVALEVGDSMASLARESPELVVLHRAYLADDVRGNTLVLAATGVSGVDALVAADARAAGVLVNCADDPEHCDLYLTSVHRSGPVTVSISSSGTSPALARWLRERLALQVGPEYARLAMLLAERRADLHARGLSTMARDWEALLTDELLDSVRNGDEARARSIIDQWEAIPA